MSTKQSIDWLGFSRGEDSEGNAIDPLSIDNGYAALMENIEPRSGRLRPRFGSALKMSGFKNVTWMGEYQKEGSGYVLILDSGTLIGMNVNSGGRFVIRENWNLENRTVSSCRVGRFLIIAVDSVDQSMVIYEDEASGTLLWFPCVISNPGNPFSKFSGVLCDENGAETDYAKYIGKSSGNFNVTEPRVITTTFVKLDKPHEGHQYDLTTGEPGAMLESYEDPSGRLNFSYLKWGKNKFDFSIISSSVTIGASLITNDAFSIPSGWSGSQSSGFSHIGGSGVNIINGSTEFVAGKKYRLSVSTSNVTAGSVSVSAAGLHIDSISSNATNNVDGKAQGISPISIIPSADFSGTVFVNVSQLITEYTCSVESDSSISDGTFNGYKFTTEIDSKDADVYILSSSYTSSTSTMQTWKLTFGYEFDTALTPGTSLRMEQSAGIDYRTDGMGNMYLTVSDSAIVPAIATHVRVYVTLPSTVVNNDFDSSQMIADGLYLRWIADIPVTSISAGVVIKIPGSDGYLKGSNNLCWSTGRDDFPGGRKIIFGGGRLWLAPTRVNSNPGRFYASSEIDGATMQLSKLLSFDLANDYVDTSTDESESAIGAGISQGNLIMFNRRSVWSLQNCDIDKNPKCISETLGAIGAIVEVNQQIYYLSQEGPAVVSGSVVERLTAMKSDKTSRIVYGKSRLFDPGRLVTGFLHNDSWVITDGEKTAAFLMRGQLRGTWTITTRANMSLVCSCSPVKGFRWVGGGGADIYSFMERGCSTDGGTPFLARLYTNATRSPKGMECGEAYSVNADIHWTDSENVGIAIIGDFDRVKNLYAVSVCKGTGMAADVPQQQYGPIMQGVRAGCASHWFMLGVEKMINDSGTLIGGLTLNVIARKYHNEQISISPEAIISNAIDEGFFGFDQDFTKGS